MNAKRLHQRIAENEAKVAVLGLGYVGLPLAIAFAEDGFPVIGLDVDAERVEELRAGRSYVDDVPDATLAPLITEKRAEFDTDFDRLRDYRLGLSGNSAVTPSSWFVRTGGALRSQGGTSARLP